jgi:hypothetical protein
VGGDAGNGVTTAATGTLCPGVRLC